MARPFQYLIPSTAALWLASPVAAQDGSAESMIACEEKASSQYISIALCPEDVTGVQLGASGAIICGQRLPCGVWFWTDATDMPEEAPDNHNGLTQDQITSALAVWVQEQGLLITIEELTRQE